MAAELKVTRFAVLTPTILAYVARLMQLEFVVHVTDLVRPIRINPQSKKRMYCTYDHELFRLFVNADRRFVFDSTTEEDMAWRAAAAHRTLLTRNEAKRTAVPPTERRFLEEMRAKMSSNPSQKRNLEMLTELLKFHDADNHGGDFDSVVASFLNDFLERNPPTGSIAWTELTDVVLGCQTVVICRRLDSESKADGLTKYTPFTPVRERKFVWKPEHKVEITTLVKSLPIQWPLLFAPQPADTSTFVTPSWFRGVNVLVVMFPTLNTHESAYGEAFIEMLEKTRGIDTDLIRISKLVTGMSQKRFFSDTQKAVILAFATDQLQWNLKREASGALLAGFAQTLELDLKQVTTFLNNYYYKHIVKAAAATAANNAAATATTTTTTTTTTSGRSRKHKRAPDADEDAAPNPANGEKKAKSSAKWLRLTTGVGDPPDEKGADNDGAGAGGGGGDSASEKENTTPPPPSAGAAGAGRHQEAPSPPPTTKQPSIAKRIQFSPNAKSAKSAPVKSAPITAPARARTRSRRTTAAAASMIDDATHDSSQDPTLSAAAATIVSISSELPMPPPVLPSLPPIPAASSSSSSSSSSAAAAAASTSSAAPIRGSLEWVKQLIDTREREYAVLQSQARAHEVRLKSLADEKSLIDAEQKAIAAKLSALADTHQSIEQQQRQTNEKLIAERTAINQIKSKIADYKDIAIKYTGVKQELLSLIQSS